MDDDGNRSLNFEEFRKVIHLLNNLKKRIILGKEPIAIFSVLL